MHLLPPRRETPIPPPPLLFPALGLLPGWQWSLLKVLLPGRMQEDLLTLTNLVLMPILMITFLQLLHLRRGPKDHTGLWTLSLRPVLFPPLPTNHLTPPNPTY